MSTFHIDAYGNTLEEIKDDAMKQGNLFFSPDYDFHIKNEDSIIVGKSYGLLDKKYHASVIIEGTKKAYTPSESIIDVLWREYFERLR